MSDPSGAVVPNAAVTAFNEATGALHRQTTTVAGVYQFSSIPPGRYTLSAEAGGFKSQRRTGITLEVRIPATVNFELEVARLPRR